MENEKLKEISLLLIQAKKKVNEFIDELDQALILIPNEMLGDEAVEEKKELKYDLLDVKSYLDEALYALDGD